MSSPQFPASELTAIEQDILKIGPKSPAVEAALRAVVQLAQALNAKPTSQ